jgi:hypothetical protein
MLMKTRKDKIFHFQISASYKKKLFMCFADVPEGCQAG